MIHIILVNYNGWEDTVECIRSLKKSTYTDYEILVVDNGSTDDSAARLRELAGDRVVLLEAGDNLGFSGGNNVGIRYAQAHGAEYILLLNNDTLVTPDTLERLLEAAKRHDDGAVITAKILYASRPEVIWYAGGRFDGRTGRTEHTGIHETDVGQYDTEKRVSFISGCCMLIPAAVLDNVGPMEEDYFLYCEDLDYCCRIAEAGYSMVYAPAAVVYHKVSASTGQASDTVTYYTVRNKCRILGRYIAPGNRWMAKVYFWLETGKRVLTREYRWHVVKRATRDAREGRWGKVTESL